MTKCRCLLPALVVLASVAAYAENSPASKTNPRPAAAGAAATETVVAPKDARWSIYCAAVGGPGHVVRAQELKNQMATRSGRRDWYVVHAEDSSTLNFGFYSSIERGSREGDHAQADMKWIHSLKDEGGNPLMPQAFFVPIDTGEVDANPEWNLAKIGRGINGEQRYWSLQIAAYTADARDEKGHDRKWAAVEMVKEMRATGIEAYYYHGAAISSVCVGAWPRNAVREQADSDKGFGAETESADMSILATNAPLPPGMQIQRGPDGKPLKTFIPRLEIMDVNMLATVRKFPAHFTNGLEIRHAVKDPYTRQPKIDPATGKPQMAAEPSFFVLVPETKSATGQGVAGRPQVPDARDPSATTDPGNPTVDQSPKRSQPKPSGVGRLKSVD